MERPIHTPINAPLQDLDTPALVIDRDNITANHDLFSQKITASGGVVIPDVSVHGSVGLAVIQTEGVKDNQIFCGNLPTAEIFREHGFSNLAITLPAPNIGSLVRVVNLAATTSLNVSISNNLGLTRLVEVAKEFNSQIDINLIVSNSDKHRGYEFDSELQNAIQMIRSSNKLKLAGFTIEARELDQDGKPDKLLDSLDSFIESQNTDIDSLCFILLHGHISNIEEYSGSTPLKIVNGAYIFEGYDSKNPEVHSCWILSTVMSNPELGRWYLDCGQKAISIDRGLPVIAHDSPIEIETMSAEHGYVISNGDEATLKLGDKIKLIPANYGDTFNLYDFINLSSHGKLVETLKVEARGAFN